MQKKQIAGADRKADGETQKGQKQGEEHKKYDLSWDFPE